MNDYNTLRNDNKSTASRSRTFQDRKFETSVEAKMRSHVVRDSADAVLNVIDRIVKDPKKLDREQRRALNDVTNTIVPVLKDTSSFFSSLANLLSPIGGLNYVDQQNQKELRKQVKNTQNNKENYRKCSPIKRLEFVKRPAEQSNQKRLIRKKRKTKLPRAFSHLPPPDDGQHFKPKEIIDIWNTVIKKYNIAQTWFAQHLISNDLVPVKKTAVCNLIHHHEIGKQTKSEWNSRGPMRYLNDEEFNAVKSELTIYDGKTIVEEELKKKS